MCASDSVCVCSNPLEWSECLKAESVGSAEQNVMAAAGGSKLLTNGSEANTEILADPDKIYHVVV